MKCICSIGLFNNLYQPMICEKCKNPTYSIYIGINHEKLCYECYMKIYRT